MLYEAEVIGEWRVDAAVERQCVLAALKSAERHGPGDFRVLTATSGGSVDVVYVKLYIIN
jgi:hypothetical protein